MSDMRESILYTACDGVQASMCVFRAPNATDAPVLVSIPAMGVRGSYYTEFANVLSNSGLNVVTTDLRGTGSSTVRASRNCDFGYREMICLDLPAIIAQVQASFPNNVIYLLGHSLGGQLGALYLSESPEAANGLILIAACNVYYKGWSSLSRWKVLGFALLLRSMGSLLGHVPAGRLGFAGNEARSVIIDWSNNCMTGRYRVKGRDHDYDASLQHMTKPVLSMSFEGDRLAPPQSVTNLLSKLLNCSVTEKRFAVNHPHLEDASHFDWAKSPVVVSQSIGAWIHELASH